MSSARELQSEESIIQGYLAPLAVGAPGALGLKDDCATLAPSHGHELVLKTDAIAEGVHFLSTDPPADVGWKALAVNASDLAAKGAIPVGYLMSLSFPKAPTAAWMSDFARGLGEAQAAFGFHLLGGDTDRRPGPIAITPMVIGEVPIGRIVRRTTAQAGDLVCVTGTLGDPGLGLRLLQEPGLAAAWRLSEADVDKLITRYRRPQPRLGLREPLLRHARASMDVSDGLMKDLGRMCRASGVGARIAYDALPLSAGFKAVQTADTSAAAASLFAGDDYEILCAVRPDDFAAFQAEAIAAGVPVANLGVFTPGQAVHLHDGNGADMTIASSGWDHF